MLREKVEIVREHLEGVNRRDWDAVMAAYHEKVVLVVHADALPTEALDAVGLEE
jgi:ketosteroid isomerase-like protein